MLSIRPSSVVTQHRAGVPSKATIGAGRAMRVVVRAEKAAEEKKEEAKPWAPPTLDPNTPSPIFGGSTGAHHIMVKSTGCDDNQIVEGYD